MSRSLAVFFIAFSLACGKRDPFDEKVIAKDLKAHPTQELYEKMETFHYDPPESARVTEAQAKSFITTLKLAARIRAVAGRQYGQQADRTDITLSRPAQFTDALAAFGSMRAYATAETRAAINLGFNPKEEEWIGKQIRTASYALDELDRITDADVAARWKEEQDPALLANIDLVERHREELKQWMP